MKREFNREMTLRVSMLDGIFASVWSGFSASFVTPFALALGAKDFLIGLLNSIPLITNSIASLTAANIAEKIKSRLKTVNVFVTLEAICWIIVAFIPLLAPNIKGAYLLIALLALSGIFGQLEGPNWTSLMGDIVEKTKYGQYFSYRSRVTGFVSLASVFLAGFVLSGFGKDNLTGFVVIFVISGASRLISAYFISCMDDVPMEIKPEKRFGYITFIKRLPESNFVKFVLFMSMMNFAINLSAPFFNVYLLRDLKFGYATYTTLQVLTALAGLLGLSFWGRVSDKHGNAKIIRFVSLFLGFFPILYIFSQNTYYIFIISMISGYVWAGMGIASVNYILDVATPAVRTRCLSYYGITNSMFSCLGATLGGYLATNVPVIWGYRLLTLFVISALLRVAVRLAMANIFKEVRPAEDIDEVRLLFRMLGLEPVLTYGEDIFIRSKVKKK